MIIVTGGAGFIGSNLVAALEEAGETGLVICDRLRQGAKWRNISKRLLDSCVPPEELIPFIDRFSQQISCIFHMGAISSTTATDGDLVLRTNFDLSVSLWHACALHGIPFIYASSAATYGDGALGFEDSNDLATLRRLRPMNLYGWSKWLFDSWVLRNVLREDALPPMWAGLRFFNVFGPNEYHKGSMQSLVSKIVAGHRPGQPVRLFKSHREDIADGDQRRDFVSVDDVVSVMLWLRNNKKSAGILNLGTGVARSFRGLAEAAIRATGEDPLIEFVDMPETIRGSYQYYTCADIGRLRQLGYTRKFTDLETSVGSYVKNYLLKIDPYR